MAAAEPGFVDAQQAEDAAARRLIRRTLSQWPLIVGCALIAAIAGFVASSSRTEQFEATTTLQLNEIDFAAFTTGQNLQQQGQDAATKAATNAKLVTMPNVRRAAAAELGGDVDADDLAKAITVTTEPDTTLIAITARDADPQRAADMANAMRTAFIVDKRETTTRQAVEARASLTRQLEAIPASQRDTVQAQTLQQRLSGVNLLVDTAGAGLNTANPAEPPKSAVSPNPRRDAILAMIAGGLLGLGVALLRARLDDRVRDTEEILEVWDVPLLGAIPQSKELANPGRAVLAGPSLEAFALTRTNLRYLHVEGDVKTLVVTSALPEEGKSTVTWNLAVASALAESKVLVIDADLRRPTVAQRLALPAARGLSEVLAGMAEAADVIVPVEIDAGGTQATIDVMPSGFVPPSPTALLERETTGALLASLAGDYDLVLIDTPPATVVADAKILLDHVDGAVVVSRLGTLKRGPLEQLRDLVSGLATPVLGVIVNGGASATDYGYASVTTTPVAAPPSSDAGPTANGSGPAHAGSKPGAEPISR